MFLFGWFLGGGYVVIWVACVTFFIYSLKMVFLVDGWFVCYLHSFSGFSLVWVWFGFFLNFV